MSLGTFSTGVDSFNALVFGEPHPSSVQYFTKQYQDIVGQADQFVGQLGQQFVQAATRVYQNYISPTALARVRNILRHVGHDTMHDMVRPLVSIQDFQQAGLTMQRWVMACPVVRDKWYDGMIEGYQDTYVDMEPGAVGLSHYDYRLATEGLLETIENEDGEEDMCYRVYYSEYDVKEGDRLLELDEKVDIQDTWHNVRVYLAQREEDPTSAVGGYM